MCRRKAALPRRTAKAVGISEAADERARVLQSGAPAPLFSRDAKQIPLSERAVSAIMNWLGLFDGLHNKNLHFLRY
jgi:hypothetical protein